MIIPLFKSHYSIGRSILTLEEETKEGGPDSVFKIAQEEDLKSIFLVEDSLMGFYQAHKISEKLGIKLCFGLRMDYSGNEDAEDGKSKIIIFAKNGEGFKRLSKISSKTSSSEKKCVTTKFLEREWSDEDLFLGIPFYDSFLYKNIMTMDGCIVDFSFTKPEFFVESNGLPMDQIVRASVKAFCDKEGFNIHESKSIFYKNKSDVEALQTYKCITSRKFGQKTLNKPNMDHFGSDEFCIESWKEAVK